MLKSVPLQTFTRAMGVKVSEAVTLPDAKTNALKRLSSIFDQRPDLTPGAANFTSLDYLGLAMHPQINEDSAKAVIETGGVSWNRTATMPRNDSSPIYTIQRTLAEWLGSEATIYMKSGVDANIGLLDLSLSYQSFPCYRDSMINHPMSMAIRFSGVKEIIYKHNDMDHLSKLMQQHGPGIIVTESVNGYLGTIAPLKDIVALAKRSDSGVYVEESHAFGMYGEAGQGLVHHLGLAPDVHMRCGDFGFAYGSMGGICAMNKAMADMFHFSATMSIFSREAEDYEALRMLSAVKVQPQEKDRVKAVFEKSDYFRNALKDIGYPVPEVPMSSQIVTLVTGSEENTLNMYSKLKEHGVFAHPFIPPIGPNNHSFLRFSVNHHLSKECIDKAIDAMKQIYPDSNANRWPSINDIF